MKIAMVSDRATTQVAELSAALDRRGHQVSLYTETPQGVGGFGQYLDASWAVDPPDVTHAHGWIAGIACQEATRHRGLPAVQTFPGVRFLPQEHAPLVEKVARTADWVAAPCTDEVFALTRMGSTRNRISVVPSGVDTGVFTPGGLRTPKGAQHRIVSVGQLFPHTGFDTLIRAMPMIVKAELVIIGDDDPRLPNLATQLGVARRVHLLGSVSRDDLPALLRSADVVACSPSYEPCGTPAIEAMACGVPVVASAVGALVDAVVHDVTGFLVPPADSGRLANAINVLLREPFLRQSFGGAGRDRAHARYSFDRIAEEMLHIYHRLARPRDPRAATSA